MHFIFLMISQVMIYLKEGWNLIAVNESIDISINSDIIECYSFKNGNYKSETIEANTKGIEFLFKKNKIEHLVVNQIELGEPDESGRRKPEIKEGSEFTLKADMVIKALGFDPENLPLLFDAQELQITKWGTIKTDFNTMETNLKGVFAAGDIVRGASLVVWAIKDGRDAASSMKTYLESMELKKTKVA